ncbi:MAG: phosphatidate cytidylyltransferase [Spirochaetaceae bacterium]|nr:phosphatidate cytidylyltransferase [Spirochaetaceae bacterium]
MMTRNTVQRLIIFFTGIPLFVLCVLYASFARNILLVLLILAVQYLSIRELSTLFRDRGITIRKNLISSLSLALGIMVYIYPWIREYFQLSFSPTEFMFMICTLFCLVINVPFAFSRPEKFESIIPELAGSLYAFFYCGILGSFIIYLISCFGQLKAPVLTFALMTFGNDSLAWLVGKTIGKKRGIVPVSPNKSLAGFIGGVLGSVIGGALAFFLFPEANFGSFRNILILGLVMAATVIIGDLVESALKRSAGVKDSSARVPGRGGILDSFDSLLFSAPVFVFVSLIMGFFPTV